MKGHFYWDTLYLFSESAKAAEVTKDNRDVKRMFTGFGVRLTNPALELLRVPIRIRSKLRLR